MLPVPPGLLWHSWSITFYLTDYECTAPQNGLKTIDVIQPPGLQIKKWNSSQAEWCAQYGRPLTHRLVPRTPIHSFPIYCSSPVTWRSSMWHFLYFNMIKRNVLENMLPVQPGHVKPWSRNEALRDAQPLSPYPLGNNPVTPASFR